jgi:nucleoside-diphosphate-sugar epimerase
MPTRDQAAVTLRGCRALVTGGLGLIGSHITDELVRAGAAEILIVDNFVRGTRENVAWALEHGPVKIVAGDIRNRALLDQLMPGIDVVFHQAAIRITQCADEPRLALEVLVDGAFNVLEAAARAGVRKVVAASSASVYGAAEDFPTREDHHGYGNRTMYGAAKLFNEGMLRSFNEMSGLNYVALRYFNVYGPRMDVFGAYTEVFIRWMNAIAAGRPPVIFGDGSQTMDFVYVADVARANVLAAAAPVTDVALNIASGVETSLTQLAEQLLAAMESPLRPEHAAERKVNPVPRRLADIGEARRLIGYEPSMELVDGLRRLVAWWHDAQAAKVGCLQ